MNDNSHATTVSVALSLYRGAPVGERPDAEELAALYEDRLSSGRRTEVLSHLANDESLYAQWLIFFEYAEELGLSAPAAIPADRHLSDDKPVRRKQKASLFEPLRRLFNSYTLIPGTALAGLAAFLLLFNVGQPPGIDQLYQQYGTSVPGRFELPTRSLGNFWADPEPEQFFLSQGFKTGLGRLSVDTSEMKLLADEPEQPAVKTLGKDEVQTLRALGEWAALTQTQCPDRSADYFAAADQVWATLHPKLEAIDAAYAESLAKAIQEVTASRLTPSGHICKIASIITKDVRR